MSTTCRFCRSSSGDFVLDLGRQPSSELFPKDADPGSDPTYPLRMWLCNDCRLAQLGELGPKKSVRTSQVWPSRAETQGRNVLHARSTAQRQRT